ncbi:MAG: cell division protein ZipA C-terminal FtsZ-binding domain-containing protein [Methyloglobulus sp.]|nr:cell division protein [Methyloglobulus sp.]
MDKELLRIVIIATGFIIMIGMILWSYLRNRGADGDPDVYEDEAVIGGSNHINDALKLHTERDEFDIVPLGSARHALDAEEEVWDVKSGWDNDDDFEEAFDDEPVQSITIPDILQFGVVANDEEGFNGVDLAFAFQAAGLEYGDLKVYERINKNGKPDYGVVCMVEPGTFPEESEDLQAFTCPGIVFYLQHTELTNAKEVFEDFIETIQQIARDLDGAVWDHQRQPLAEATIKAIRQSL